MSLFAIDPAADPLEVVIAGGGVAALEAVLALHAQAPGRVRTTLVAPNEKFVQQAVSVAEPFGLIEPRSWDLADIAHAHGAMLRQDAVVAVDGERHMVRTASGDELPYDALLLATGARRVLTLEGAIAFRGSADSDSFAALLRETEAGDVKSIAFAVPRGVVWSLPLYELALMTAAHLATRGVRGVELTVATPERAPLALFGRRASDTVAALLRGAGVALRVAAPERVEPGRLVLAHEERVEADRVVALPRLEAPDIEGVPRASDGFIRTDLHCRVPGLDGVYAAGDATWYPVKQGGIAAQQADTAVSEIAARAGAPVVPRSFRPVLRGALLTGEGVRYLRHIPRGRDPEPSDAALWWPPAKIAGRYLGPYLAGDGEDTPDRGLEDVPRTEAGGERATLAMALEAADADAGWGDYGGALRWLGVAERLAIALPHEYAEKRERWLALQAGLPVAGTVPGTDSGA